MTTISYQDFIKENVERPIPTGYTGTTGTDIGIAMSTTAPSEVIDGTMWFNSEEGKMYVRFNNAWIGLR